MPALTASCHNPYSDHHALNICICAEHFASRLIVVGSFGIDNTQYADCRSQTKVNKSVSALSNTVIALFKQSRFQLNNELIICNVKWLAKLKLRSSACIEVERMLCIDLDFETASLSPINGWLGANNMRPGHYINRIGCCSHLLMRVAPIVMNIMTRHWNPVRLTGWHARH